MFKVYVNQYYAYGALKHSEFVGGYHLESEAQRTAANERRTIAECGNSKTHHVVIKREES